MCSNLKDEDNLDVVTKEENKILRSVVILYNLCYTNMVVNERRREKMSPIREKFVKTIESLPYDLDEEILRRSIEEILQEITRKYVDTYGTDDLSENDKECIELLIGYRVE